MRPFYTTLVAVSFLLVLLPPTRTVARRASERLDMTRLARRFPRHRGPTILFVNFDGWRRRQYHGLRHRIDPFRSRTGQRERDIQDILFRTAQTFAPFDVQVRRRWGDGNYYGRRRGENRGHTTIFVGGDSANVNRLRRKHPRGYTPWRHTDYPSRRRGTRRPPHSDRYHLAFVDPMGQAHGGGWTNVRTNFRISKSIAHEAGHTFGLVHTLTAPVPDLMSYNAPMLHFTNRTFPITDLNFDARTRKKKHAPANQPRWKKTLITRQNSFTFLAAVLGRRPPGLNPRVADRSSVDVTYREPTPLELAPPSALQDKVGRLGDYNVYRLRVPFGQRLAVTARRADSGSLKPVLLIYDGSGQYLLHLRGNRSTGGPGCRVEFWAEPGRSYQVVVGGCDGTSRGRYQLTVRMLVPGQNRLARRYGKRLPLPGDPGELGVVAPLQWGRDHAILGRLRGLAALVQALHERVRSRRTTYPLLLEVPMRMHIVLALAAGLLVAADKPKEDAAAAERKKLEGTWKVVRSEEDGKKSSAQAIKDLKLVFKGNKVSIRKGGKTSRSYSFTLDPTKKPRQINVTALDGKAKGKTGLGIYELEGDTLKICTDNRAKKRPTDFNTSEQMRVSLFVLKREKS
jgi:uncharacterized protein (TIGR03067 family)